MKKFLFALILVVPFVSQASQIVPKRVSGRYVAIANDGNYWSYGSSDFSLAAAESDALSALGSGAIVSSGNSCCATALSSRYYVGRRRSNVDFGTGCAGSVSVAAQSARESCESQTGRSCSTTGAVCNH